jgi:hypothetical protein
MNNVANFLYCTQPRKVSGKWTMNVHEYGVTLGQAVFSKKENALKFRAELDNWDKLSKRVGEEQPVQLALAI